MKKNSRKIYLTAIILCSLIAIAGIVFTTVFTLVDFKGKDCCSSDNNEKTECKCLDASEKSNTSPGPTTTTGNWQANSSGNSNIDFSLADNNSINTRVAFLKKKIKNYNIHIW